MVDHGSIERHGAVYTCRTQNACSICPDRSQIQALDRTQPMLRLKPSQVERHTHDYKRNGTLSLFATLEVATSVAREYRANADQPLRREAPLRDP